MTFKDVKKIMFSIFFSDLPTGTLSSLLKINFFAKILRKNPVLQALFHKREGSGAGSVTLTNGSGSWRPRNMRILRIRIPNTGYKPDV
jgi:hypothetical protein